jgi:predicted secreted protein
MAETLRQENGNWRLRNGHLIEREGVDGEADAAKLGAKNTAQRSRNQKILQRETKQTKAGRSFAKNGRVLGNCTTQGAERQAGRKEFE